MHVSRKRYRPLDSAEERAVYVNQRLQLLSLEDEQSYCFSWPEAPLTQWLLENPTYANLHQLIAGVTVDGSSANSAGSGSSNALRAGSAADALPNSKAGNASSSRRDVGAGSFSTSASSFSSGNGAAAVSGLSSRRQVDLPPVFTLSDVTDAPLLFSAAQEHHTPPLGQPGSFSGARENDEVHMLLQQLQREMNAVHRAVSTFSAREDVESTSQSMLAQGASNVHVRQKGRRTRSPEARENVVSIASTAAICISPDAAPAAPHPLAPPRPQSITEDSIFTLSASQLVDLANAGVPALCTAEEKWRAAQQQQQQQLNEQHLQHSQTKPPPLLPQNDEGGGDARHRTPSPSGQEPPTPQKSDDDEALPALTATHARVVVIDEGEDGEGTANRRDGAPSNKPYGHFPPQMSTSPRDRSAASAVESATLSESQRRAVEAEVVALEWRTWTQSQRTAAALQRLLSLEAAIPFESCGDVHRDAWRSVVYRLWLRWRQQYPSDASSAAKDRLPAPAHRGHHGGPIASPTALTVSPYGVRAPPASSTLSSSPPPPSPQHPHQPPFMQTQRLPWGPPLLIGAYLYGTSNDYFISLPPTAAVAGAGSGGTSTSVAGPIAASMWPAMSRRRGVYSFLRWKLELYTPQMPHRADTVSDGAEADLHTREHRMGGADRATARRGAGEEAAVVVDVDEDKESDAEAETTTPPSLKVSRYAKGPLGEAGTFASGRPRRRTTAGAPAADTSDTTASPPSVSSPTPTAATSRRPTAPRTASATSAASTRPPPHYSLNTVMSAAQIKALIQTTVLTQPLTELQMDDEPSAVMERLACPDLKHETDAWRVWLSKV